MYESIKDSMANIETIVALHVEDTPLAKICRDYEKDVGIKVMLIPWALPVITLFRAAAKAQGSTFVEHTTKTFTVLGVTLNTLPPVSVVYCLHIPCLTTFTSCLKAQPT